MGAEQSFPPILVLAYYYPPQTASGAARPHRLTKYLKRLGHDVQVIGARTASENPSPMPDVYRVITEGEGDQRVGLTGFIERCFRKAIFHHDPGVLWAGRVIGFVPSLYRDREQPVVISSAPPLTPHLAALGLKLRYGWPWIADCRDPLVGNPFRFSSATVRTDPCFERLMMRHADAVIANTDRVARMWEERYPQWKSKIRVLWNGFDPESAPAARPLSGEGPKLLTHVGVIYGDRDPIPILSELAELFNAGVLDAKQLKIRLYGPVDLPSQTAMSGLEAIARQGWLDLRNEFIPKAEAARLTAETDYLLLLDVLGDAAGLQVPAKLFEYICIGRPILASTAAGSPVEQILRRCGIPHVCFPGHPTDESRRQMREFFSLPSTSHRPSEWFQSNFSAENQAAFLSSLVMDVSGRIRTPVTSSRV